MKVRFHVLQMQFEGGANVWEKIFELVCGGPASRIVRIPDPLGVAGALLHDMRLQKFLQVAPDLGMPKLLLVEGMKTEAGKSQSLQKRLLRRKRRLPVSQPDRWKSEALTGQPRSTSRICP